MPRSRNRRKNINKHRRTRIKQRGGLLGHFIGWHLSDRGIRHILMGNHRVKPRYTEKLRAMCKDRIMYHPKITYKDEKMQKSYDTLRKQTPKTTDDVTFICGNSNHILKHSPYGPDGSQFIGEGFKNALQETYYKLYPPT